MTGGALATLEGSGHIPLARDPVKVNLLLRDFVERTRKPKPGAITSSSTWIRGRGIASKRALYVSRRSGWATRAATWRSRRSCAARSPAWRSTGSPSTRSPGSSQAEGERIHPASAVLANESPHIERESAEHDLHAFQAIRRMDEILIANFMLFHDAVRDRRTTCGSATRPGRSTTTCTRTRTESAPPSSG